MQIFGTVFRKSRSKFSWASWTQICVFTSISSNIYFNVPVTVQLYGAEKWTLREADQKYLESFEMWCWKRMEKISWTDHVRNEEVLLRVNEERNILYEIRKRKANWMGHFLRRNCLLKQVIEGNIKREMEVSRRRGRKRKKLLDDLKERRGYSHLKEETLDRTIWRSRFRGGFEPVFRQNTEWMNESHSNICLRLKLCSLSSDSITIVLYIHVLQSTYTY